MIYLKDYDNRRRIWHAGRPDLRLGEAEGLALIQIGRASCRERV